ncbi:MAG: hypothetical protein WCJ30_12780, partial [Deltaproteobacteria bacterium]
MIADLQQRVAHRSALHARLADVARGVERVCRGAREFEVAAWIALEQRVRRLRGEQASGDRGPVLDRRHEPGDQRAGSLAQLDVAKVQQARTHAGQGRQRRGRWRRRGGTPGEKRFDLQRHRGQIVPVAHGTRCPRGLTRCAEPRVRASRQPAHRLERDTLGRRPLGAPAQRLRVEKQQRPECFAARAAPHTATDALRRRGEVVRGERLLGRTPVPQHGALGFASALQMLGQDQGRGLARQLQPVCGEPVSDTTIVLREHRVGRLAHQRVAEYVLLLAAKVPLAAPRDHFALRQGVEPPGDVHGVLAEQRGHAARPEHLPEDA